MDKSKPTLKYKSGRYCCVEGCHSRQGREDVRFSRFPKRNQEQAELWRMAIDRKNKDGSSWHPGSYDLICGLHFVSKKPNTSRNHPDYVPSLFSSLHKKAKTETDVQRYQRSFKRRKASIPLLDKDAMEKEAPFEDIPPEPDGAQIEDIPPESATSSFRTSHSGFLERALVSEEKFRSAFGIPQLFFQYSVSELSDKLSAYPSLSKEEQIALFWMKLKTNESFILLGLIFDISHKAACEIFFKVLEAQFKVAHKELCWYTREEVQAMLPQSFKLNYPKTRVIIDAVEIKIQTPMNESDDVLCWSSLKHIHSLRFLVAITPSGTITFISKTYGERASNDRIINDCGILSLLEKDDLLMVGQGFPHIEEDISDDGGELLNVLPLFNNGNEPQENTTALRNHVERAGQRFDIFNILNSVENTLIPHVDKIIVIIAHAINFFPPLISDSNEMTLHDFEDSL